jgi:transcriptional regulator with XRE-family HTH domain
MKIQLSHGRSYKAWVNAILRDIFESARTVWNYSLPELANYAGLSVTTIYRYYHRKVQRHSLDVIFRLCRAVGYDLAIAKEELAASLAKTSNRRKAA